MSDSRNTLWRGLAIAALLLAVGLAQPAQALDSKTAPDAEQWQQRLNLRIAHAEYVRHTLLGEIHKTAIKSAQTFLDFARARMQRGNQTTLDVTYAEMALRSCELEKIKNDRLLVEATLDLKETAGADADAEKRMKVAALDFGALDLDEERKDENSMKIVSDEAAGVVALKPAKNDNANVAAKILFRAARFNVAEVTQRAENLPPAEKARLKRKIESVARAVSTLEKELLVEGLRIECAKLTTRATYVSFVNGFKDSFEVSKAEESLLKAKINFINCLEDYEIQLGQLEFLSRHKLAAEGE
jgi:hypothetical protein